MHPSFHILCSWQLPWQQKKRKLNISHCSGWICLADITVHQSCRAVRQYDKKARALNAGIRKSNAVSCQHRAGVAFTGQVSHICVHVAQMMVLEVMQCGNKCTARNAKMLADIRTTSSKVVGLPFFRAQKQTNMSARMQTCLLFCQINEKGCDMNS